VPDCAQGGAIILLVEDEGFVRNVIAETLQLAGYYVLTANDAQRALEICRSAAAIDLLLTDLIMPGMSGLELRREFSALFPGGQVLLMSGHIERIAVDEFSLMKPFSSGTLLRKVGELMAGAEAPVN
jgi:two-component system cell cycle sensor histidine kinase/response regulator CckA